MGESIEVPLFPLGATVFPGGVLPLRIFEARYLDMVSRCLRDELPFGVCLIRQGTETGSASIYPLGTLARIVDWERRDDGLLGIVAQGEARFRLLSSWQQDDRLMVGEVAVLEEQPDQPLPAGFGAIARLLEELLDKLDAPYRTMPRRLDEAGWVADRMAELLPLETGFRQALLEESDPGRRLGMIAEALSRMQGEEPRPA